VQNALPVWHTHSTVTGSATALGLASTSSGKTANPGTHPLTAAQKQSKREEEDRALAEHYRTLEEEEEQERQAQANGNSSPAKRKGVDQVYIKPEPAVVTSDFKMEDTGDRDDLDVNHDAGATLTGERFSMCEFG
jgi:hypothetical protein